MTGLAGATMLDWEQGAQSTEAGAPHACLNLSKQHIEQTRADAALLVRNSKRIRRKVGRCEIRCSSVCSEYDSIKVNLNKYDQKVIRKSGPRL